MNRWYFWVLAPVMLGAAVLIPNLGESPSLSGRVIGYALSGTLVLATLGLANPMRFRWALRMVAVAVLAAGLAYFVTELVAWRNGKPMGVFGRRSDTSLRNAALFLVIFGLPALRYLRRGRSGSAIDVIAAPETLADDTDDESRPPTR